MKWTPKNGVEVELSRLDDKYLLEVISDLQKLAETKRRAMIAIHQEYAGVASHHVRRVLDTYSGMVWRSFVDCPTYDYLAMEASRRGLAIPTEVVLEEDLPVPLTERGSLERQIVGALRDTIHAHGAITKATAPSAAKRVIGAIRYHNRKVMT